MGREIQAESGELNEALQRYLVHLQLEKGASPRTLSSYESDLEQLMAYLTARGIQSCREITHGALSGYLAALATQKVNVGRPTQKKDKKAGHALSSASASRKITSMRTFLKFLFTENIISQDFTERISAPKQKRKLPQTLTLAQYEKLLAAIPGETPQGMRDRAMVELMFSSGLRVSEICALTLTDWDEEAGFLRIMGKGSKERVVPMGGAAISALKKYLESARVTFVRPKKTYSHVFLSARGSALSRVTVWLMLKNYARRAGIPPALVKPHGLRHSFATELLKGGADLRLIQGLLGHSSIATTQIYTSVESSHLIETHEEFHPRSHMSVK